MIQHKNRLKFLKDVYKNMKNDGLNSIEYNVTEVRKKKLYTHIFVTYDQEKIVGKKYVNLNMTVTTV